MSASAVSSILKKIFSHLSCHRGLLPISERSQPRAGFRNFRKEAHNGQNPNLTGNARQRSLQRQPTTALDSRFSPGAIPDPQSGESANQGLLTNRREGTKPALAAINQPVMLWTVQHAKKDWWCVWRMEEDQAAVPNTTCASGIVSKPDDQRSVG